MPYYVQMMANKWTTVAIEFLQQRKYAEQRRVLRMVPDAPFTRHPVMAGGRIGNNLG